MAQGDRPVSIVEVGLAGVLTVVRRWPYALAVVASPLAAVLGMLALSMTLRGADWWPILALVLMFLSWFLSLAVAQLAAFHGQAGQWRPRVAVSPAAWISDLARLLVLTVVWLVVAVVLEVLLYEAGKISGLNDVEWAQPLIVVGSLTLLTLPLVAMGFAAAAAFAERRWTIFRRPPDWSDMWRILVGYLIVGIQLGGIWWGAVAGFSWLARPEVSRSLGGAAKSWLTFTDLGLALGLSMLCLAPAWAQAWRQSLGRPLQDPASVFD